MAIFAIDNTVMKVDDSKPGPIEHSHLPADLHKYLASRSLNVDAI